MKKISLLVIFALIFIAACSKPKTTNISANNQTNLNSSANVISTTNANLSNSGQSSITENNSAVNKDILRQIEAQQLETADPRKAPKVVNKSNGNQSPKKTTSSSAKQTW